MASAIALAGLLALAVYLRVLRPARAKPTG
jgi:hypothetical protein